MSFKHTKHWDSEVMRSLEKVAYEKGMVKSDPLQKQASLTKEADITPTSDLMQNIVKLCVGLRSEGLEKEAAEIETNFLNYKQAQTLYETSKEKGEDLVDAAHPKGSHKLEGVDSEEAVVEDIVDRHNKMKAVVDKKPTGKYASSKDILNAVKVTLGADPLANGRANSSRKIAQEAAPKKSNSTGYVEGAATAAGLGITLFQAWKILGNFRVNWNIGVMTKALKVVQAYAKSGHAGAQAFLNSSPKTVSLIEQAASGLKASPTAISSAATEAKAALSVARQASSMAGEAALPIETALETAVEGSTMVGTEAVGAETAALTAATPEAAASVGLFGSLASGVAVITTAAIAGTMLGLYINDKLYDADFYSKDLKESGDKITSYAQHNIPKLVYYEFKNRDVVKMTQGQLLNKELDLYGNKSNSQREGTTESD